MKSGCEAKNQCYIEIHSLQRNRGDIRGEQTQGTEFIKGGGYVSEGMSEEHDQPKMCFPV